LRQSQELSISLVAASVAVVELGMYAAAAGFAQHSDVVGGILGLAASAIEVPDRARTQGRRPGSHLVGELAF